MLYFHHIPSFVQKIYHKRIWHIPSSDKVLFLTFDDGPHPGTTPEILNLLSKFRAKVTFFQLGSKIDSYPSLHKRCKAEGHIIGNHGYYHLDALNTSSKDFLANMEEGMSISKSDLYRPAYGRLPFLYKKKIFSRHNVIMWDVMPGDFDYRIDIDSCKSIIGKNVSNGSIIVLHENDKSKNKILPILSWILNKYSKEGYHFRSISLNNNELSSSSK